MNDRSLHADVIIVGGGLAGCTLAILLAQKNIRCLLIEEHIHFTKKKKKTDPRTLAITRGSENILRTTGAWENLKQDKIGYFRKMFVWDENGDGDIRFDSAELCEPTLGTIIEQTALELALQKQTEQFDCIEWIQSKLIAFEREEKKITIELEDGLHHNASLIVAADGARSTIRSLANISFPQHDYQQNAVACIVETEKPHEQIARQRFMSTGPLAFLPMADPHQCGVVWSTSSEHAEKLLAMEETEFNRALADAFTGVVGNIISSNTRASFPLLHAQAENYCKPRLALIGDAAHTVHPLAGQGANLGLLDAATLAEVIHTAKEKQRDIGNYYVLRRYERWRKSENYIALKILQGFKYLFENQLDTVKRLRNIGLDLTDTITPLKYFIMRNAMGLSGDLPVSARRIH
jgi:2-octaprenylphenol hydroxylase